MLSLRSVYGNEKGIVILVALMLLVILSVMGSAAVVFTRTDLKIAANYKNSTVAFNRAEAGVSHAKRALTDNTNWNALLAASSTICPGLSDCTYTIENDPNDPGGATTDTNNVVIARAEGQYGNAKKEIQLAFTRGFPQPPGALNSVGIGAALFYSGQANEINGTNYIPPADGDVTGEGVLDPTNSACGTNPKWGVVVPNATIRQTLVNETSENDYDSITGAPANDPPIEGIPEGIDIPSIGVDDTFMPLSQLDSMADQLIAMADLTLNPGDIIDNGEVGGVPVNTGTQADPKIVAVDCTGFDSGERCLSFWGNTTGAGILVVRNGKLLLRATIQWTGIVIVVGDHATFDTGGGGTDGNIVYGTVFIGETVDVTERQFRPRNTKLRFSCDAFNMANNLASPLNQRALWWKEVM